MAFSNVLKSAIVLAFIIILQSCEEEVDLPDLQNQQSGTIVTVAGMGPEEFDHKGDGDLATSASLGWVVDVTLDSNNNLYIVDGAANTIRKVTQEDQVINTVAGTFVGFNAVGDLYQGDGGPAVNAQLAHPWGVAVDTEGNIYIADSGNSTVRMVIK
jgi:DNA-binding beta-propeller fold protein YncE